MSLLTEENKRMKAIVRMLMDKIKSGEFDDLKFEQAKQLVDKDPNVNPAAKEESVDSKKEVSNDEPAASPEELADEAAFLQKKVAET